MSSEEIVISVRGLSKVYRLFGHPEDRIKQFFSLGLRQYSRDFTALQDVSFDVRKGEIIGIIGRNGSGKSTLLQLLCGILKPSKGTVKVNGRISALLELGAGFNPEFTGRENVYFQGAIMGVSKEEMGLRFEDIESFADIGEFIDQPVRTYSSGMFVRLAFSTAIHVDPDILIIDEALGVGDQVFQTKCLEYIDTLRAHGGTIVFVSHSLEQIAHHCHTALLLERGRLITIGDTESTLATYLNRLDNATGKALVPELDSAAASREDSTDRLSAHPSYWHGETRWGDGKARILEAQISQHGITNPMQVLVGQPMEIAFDVSFIASVSRPIFGLTVKSDRGATVITINSRELSGPSRDFSAGERSRVCFGITPWLDSGRYLLSLGVASDTSEGVLPHDRRYDVLAISLSLPRTESGVPDTNPSFTLAVLK